MRASQNHTALDPMPVAAPASFTPARGLRRGKDRIPFGRASLVHATPGWLRRITPAHLY
ncbi:MAG TPA: hypothetical protein VI320_17820 [Terracidiphilus sp.]